MRLKGKYIDPLLIGIALLAFFLNVYGIWQDQYANAYYTAAVTSMLQSFHNFFFASFDPGGFVTVDKPPVAFWVQTAFAAVFGVHGWSVILPQALAGVGSVLLVYLLVKPSLGRGAARVGALVMACTPIAAAVSRSNNVDSLLVFTLLLATWLLFRGVRKSKPSLLLGAFALVGVAFNIKMLQAYMVLPAFYIFYWLAFKVNWKKKISVLAGSTAIMLLISFSWALIVDSIPQANRPYIGSSQTNSVLELAFGYNGLARLTGQGGPGGGNRRVGGQIRQETSSQSQTGNAQFTYGFTPARWDGSTPNSTPSSGNGPFNQPGPMGDGRIAGKSGGGMFNTGTPGPLRLFQAELSGQISWLLPFALLSALGMLIGIRRKQSLTDKEKESIFWLAWLLPMMGFFSVAGFFHQYYLVMLAPAIAVLTGAGWVELIGLNRNNEGWKKWLLPIGILGTIAFQLFILWPYRTQTGWGLPISVGALGTILAIYFSLPFAPKEAVSKQTFTVRGKLTNFAAAGGILVMLAGPLYWASTPMIYGDNAMMPAAGPQQTLGDNRQPNQLISQHQDGAQGQMIGQGAGQMRETVDAQLLAYLEAHNTGEKFLFATTNINTAESYIIKTGKAVMAMGGFSGSDPILTVAKLKQMVADKQVKYFLISGGGPGGGVSSDVQTWIKQNAAEIPQSEWQSGSGSNSSGDLRMNGFQTLYEINS